MKEVLIWVIFIVSLTMLEALIFEKRRKSISVLLGVIRFVFWMWLSSNMLNWFIFLIVSLFIYSFIDDVVYWGVKRLKKVFIYNIHVPDLITVEIFWRFILFLFGIGLTFAL